MKLAKLIPALAAVFLASAIAQQSYAGDCCCACGSDCGVRKVCRLVCEKKKIETVCYGCECEDYCLPGKSCRGCLNSESVCTGDCATDCCSKGPLCCLEWFDWKPTCAKLHHRKKLVKYVVTKEVPSYTWKVEEVCGSCCPDSACSPGPDGIPVERRADQNVPAEQNVSYDDGDVPLPPSPASASFNAGARGQ